MIFDYFIYGIVLEDIIDCNGFYFTATVVQLSLLFIIYVGHLFMTLR